MRLRSVLFLSALLVALLPPPAAAAPAVELDLPDPPEDVIVDPRSGPSFSAARPNLDLLRVQQRMDGEDILLVLTFAAPPGEPNADMDVLASVQRGGGLGEQVIFGVNWDAQGNPQPPGPAMNIIGGQPRNVTVAVAVEGVTLTLRISGVPADAPCFTAHTISFGVRKSEAEYTEWYYPAVSTCDANDVLAGAQGACPAAKAPEKDPLVLTLDDEQGDVRRFGYFGDEEGTVSGEDLYDVRGFTSARDGDRVVQSVELGEPRNASRALFVEVIHRLSGGQDRDLDPEDALVVRYWRFANGSLADRVEGEHVGAGDGNNDVRFPVELSVSGSTLTFSWCASILPADARCVGIEVEAGSGQSFMGGVRDHARPAVDPCLTARAAGSDDAPPVDDEPPADDEFTDEEFTEEDPDAGGNESPLGAGVVLAALAVAVLLVRRR